MQVLPLAIWYKGSDDKLIEDAYAQSHIKHAHIRSKVCYALYCLWARSILNGSNIKAAWKEAVFKLCDYLKNKPNDLDELENHIKPDELETHTGRDYVVDCLKSALFALQQKTYKDVIKTAIILGHNTDTTACFTCGIVGLYFGFNAIPPQWFKQLRGKELVDPLLQKLY